jgi:hypothetical protein
MRISTPNRAPEVEDGASSLKLHQKNNGPHLKLQRLL